LGNCAGELCQQSGMTSLADTTIAALREFHDDLGALVPSLTLAQRLRPTAVANQISEEAAARAADSRQRHLIGLHRPGLYDG
jgi:hypothetical protein